MSQHRTIVIFLKFPVAGKVKSRLGRTIGFEESARVYRQLVARVLEIVSEAEKEEVIICYDPPEAESATRDWLGEIANSWSFLPQTAGDLGDRLMGGVETAFASGATRVVAIGTDCIELTPDCFSEVWERLEAEEKTTVFGPTFDGGYYLVGLNARCPAIFTDIPWSAENTLAASIVAAETAGNTVVQLKPLSDIDDETDLIAARKRGVF